MEVEARRAKLDALEANTRAIVEKHRLSVLLPIEVTWAGQIDPTDGVPDFTVELQNLCEQNGEDEPR
jgi:hypothetical protein